MRLNAWTLFYTLTNTHTHSHKIGSNWNEAVSAVSAVSASSAACAAVIFLLFRQSFYQRPDGSVL